MKKWIIIICSFIFAMVLGITMYFVFFNKEERPQKVDETLKPINELSITLKENMETTFMSKVKVSDFIDNVNYELVDDFEIETNSIGEKEVEFSLKDVNGYTEMYNYTINVRDTEAPTIWVSSSYSVSQYSSIDLAKSIMCIDDYDENPTCVVEGYYNTNVIGTYPLVYKATDSSGNTKEESFNLIVTNGSSSPYYGEPIMFSDVLSKYKNDDTMIGLDISAWQGEIDFDKIKNAGVEFVILRVGSEDNYGRFVDKWFNTYYDEAKRVGLKIGAYYYSYAENIEYAKEDAKFVLEALKGKELDLPVAFDFEEWSMINKFRFSKYSLTMMAKAFLDEIKKGGYEGMNYSSKAYLEKIWMDTTYPTWLAHYIDQTNYTGEYSIWQFSSMVSIDGVGGRVDCNVAYKNKMN